MSFISNTISILFIYLLMHAVDGQLTVGFYSKSCPRAETIVESVVREATTTEPRMPPILLRLHFHDYFVEGCDGSILITDTRATHPEMFARGHSGVGGFELIDKAKDELEQECPGTVSCADIVALAARDAIVLVGGPSYEVETGRKDGLVSDARLAKDMPEVDDSIEILKTKFKAKGFMEQELALLSGGAHTIGTTACLFTQKRLYNFTGRNDSDPTINLDFLPVLKGQCPKESNLFTRIPIDHITGQIFDDQIFDNIKNGTAVLASDARLYDDSTTRRVVDSYALGSQPSSFGQDFTAAIVKLGRVGVKTGVDGEIRRVCHLFNY